MELQRFQDDKLDRIKSFLSPNNHQKSIYTLSDWENICTRLKLSLVLMEQIIVSTNFISY